MPTPEQSYREIKLTQGQFALVDAKDYGRIASHKWYAAWAPNTQSFYAHSKIQTERGQRDIYMHRVILGLDFGDKRHGDHINQNTLDNRRCNLRIATIQQNMCNRGKNRNNTSGYKGVMWRSDISKWRAQIRVDRKLISLGSFSTAEDAHAAYCAAADRLHGDFAKTI